MNVFFVIQEKQFKSEDKPRNTASEMREVVRKTKRDNSIIIRVFRNCEQVENCVQSVKNYIYYLDFYLMYCCLQFKSTKSLYDVNNKNNY